MAVLKIIDGKMCISVDGLAATLGGDREVSMKTIWNGMLKNRNLNRTTYQHYPDSDDGRRRWIVIDSLPKVAGMKVTDHYGDVADYYRYERWIAIINMSIDPADGVWYIMQRVEERKAILKGRSCAWMRLMSKGADRDDYDRVQDMYEAYIRALHIDTAHDLKITNWRSLRRKVQAWDAVGRAALIDKYGSNTNAAKVTDAGRAYIINSYSSPLKPTTIEVAKLYNATAVDKGWKEITAERVRQIVNDKEVAQAIHASRHGLAVTRNAHERTIKRKAPSMADGLWSLDGFTIQLRYRANGAVLSGLYGVAVMDVYSDMVIGIAIGNTETAVLVQQSLRDAVRKTMMTPLQLQYDNSSANKSMEVRELMERISRWAFPTAPYNGKSKPIENLIGRIEGHNMRHMPNFKGGNITSHSLSIKANPDFLDGQELPDMATAIEQFKVIIDVHNNTIGSDGKSPVQRYATPHELRRPMEYISMVQAFWVERRDRVRYTKDGLTIEVGGQRYTYEVETERGIEDMDFRLKYLGTRFVVKYDPDDLEYISLWLDGIHIADAREKWLAPMAIVDMQPGDRQRIDKALEQRRAYIDRLKTQTDALRKVVDNENLPTELSHYLLHKDAYNVIEQKLIDQDISQQAMQMIGYPDRAGRKRKNTLYDSEGSMEVVE